MPGSIITLTTDFGLSDHYVGVVKGVILRFHPEACIVDLTHEIEPYDLLGASLSLEASHSYFSPRTVHLVVVDPGVGGARRPIAAEAGEWLFVAPDNGVLEGIYRRYLHRVWALRPERFALQPVSNTFHARDVFAPAAALLARGEPPDQLGELVTDYVRLEIPCPREVARGCWLGTVLKVDRFGNLITNFRSDDFPRSFRLSVGAARVSMRRNSYAEAAPGEIFAIAGSAGYIEVSMREARAADAARVDSGAGIELESLHHG